MLSKCTDRISAPDFISVGYWWKETLDVGSWHSSEDKVASLLPRSTGKSTWRPTVLYAFFEILLLTVIRRRR